MLNIVALLCVAFVMHNNHSNKKNMKPIYKNLLRACLLFLATAGVLFILGQPAIAGPFLIAGFVALAFGVRGKDSTKPFSFTASILAVVTLTLYFPQLFLVWGRTFGEDGEILRNGLVLTAFITPLMQIIMFGMGSQMSLDDFKGVIKMPKGVLIGVVSSFLVMPIVAFTIVNIFTFHPDPVMNASIAVGVILVGVVPTGLASNVMTYIAKGNLPLSITMTSVSTLLAPVITPLLFVFLTRGLTYGIDTGFEILFWPQMINILHMIILPIIAGFTFNLFYKKETRQAITRQVGAYLVIILAISFLPAFVLDATFGSAVAGLGRALAWFLILPIVGALCLHKVLKGDMKLIKTILGSFSTVGIAVIIAVTTSAGRDAFLAVGALLILTNFIHNITGYSLGYGIATLFRMSETDRRTVALECGMQNGGLASGLANQMGQIATIGLAPAVWGPIMNSTGSALASFWSSRPPKDGSRDDKEEL